MLNFPVILTPDDNETFLVTFPDVPEAHTFGDTEEDALSHARDALETALEMYVEDRRALPRPSPRKSGRFVSPGSLVSMKLGIYQAMLDQRVNKSDLARRLGVHMPQVDRLLDLRHHSRLDLVEEALSALGLRLVVDVKKAA